MDPVGTREGTPGNPRFQRSRYVDQQTSKKELNQSKLGPG